jgi:SHS2 domain-containing protein
MYEIFEHTADLGLRVRAADLGTLFAEAGAALFSVVVEDLGSVEPATEEQFALDADRPDDLLHDWLSELLFVFHTRRMLLAEFDVAVDLPRLAATARGEPVAPDRHRLGEEIKAITYHRLRVEREGDGWLAEVIVDI